jgi:hypothetical protein
VQMLLGKEFLQMSLWNKWLCLSCFLMPLD